MATFSPASAPTDDGRTGHDRETIEQELKGGRGPRLAADGIHWSAGEEREVIDQRTGELYKETLPDDVAIEVEAFNRRVITEPFNQAVCHEVAKHIDPSLLEKTLVFFVDDDHADLVARVLKAALKERHLGVDDDAVQKIAGKADKPLERIRHFRNESLPRVAVTVDLLTTGIDVCPPNNLRVGMIATVRNRRRLVVSVDPFDARPLSNSWVHLLTYADE